MGNIILKNKLKKFDIKNNKPPKFEFVGYTTFCKVIKVYDGDTVTIAIKFKGKFYREQCRLAGIDAPELKTKDQEEKRLAIAAKLYLEGLVLNKVVKIKCGEWEKYGRLLGTLYIRDEKSRFLGFGYNINVNQVMIGKRHAKPYDGGTKDSWKKNGNGNENSQVESEFENDEIE